MARFHKTAARKIAFAVLLIVFFAVACLTYLYLIHLPEGRGISEGEITLEFISLILLGPISTYLILNIWWWRSSMGEDIRKIIRSPDTLERFYPDNSFLKLKSRPDIKAAVEVLPAKGVKRLKAVMSPKEFELDHFFKTHYLDIMKAHEKSATFNSRAIRVKDVRLKGRDLVLECQPCHYYDYLATNLAMDYELTGDVTIRQIFEPGPRISPLARSRLANILAVEMLIKTRDDYYILQQRTKRVAIAKGLISSSVSGTIHYEPCFSSGRFDLLDGIEEEIEEETGFKLKDFKAIQFIGISIDVSRGTLPHIMLYGTVDRSFAELENLNRYETKRFIPVKDLEHYLVKNNKRIAPVSAATIIAYLNESPQFPLKGR